MGIVSQIVQDILEGKQITIEVLIDACFDYNGEYETRVSRILAELPDSGVCSRLSEK